MTAPRSRGVAHLWHRIYNRYKAGKMVGHLNARRCDPCGGWHHTLYHQRGRGRR